jgi:hypothetical protein
MNRRRARFAWAPAVLVGAVAASCSTRGSTPATIGDADAAFDGAFASDAGDAGDASVETPDVGPDARVVREFDLGREFSPTANPTGVWRLAYTTDATLSTANLALEAFHDDVANIHFWHPGADGGTNLVDYYPYVAGNATTATTTDVSNSWAVRDDQLAIEGSNSGQYAVVVFVAPEAGYYRMQADFEGIHFRLSTTDVHVRRGDTPLFDALIDGYGGDPAFHAIEGASPRASYQGTVTLAAGDTLSFAIGYGANKTYNNDTTGLTLRIQEVQ